MKRLNRENAAIRADVGAPAAGWCRGGQWLAAAGRELGGLALGGRMRPGPADGGLAVLTNEAKPDCDSAGWLPQRPRWALDGLGLLS